MTSETQGKEFSITDPSLIKGHFCFQTKSLVQLLQKKNIPKTNDGNSMKSPKAIEKLKTKIKKIDLLSEVRTQLKRN